MMFKIPSPVRKLPMPFDAWRNRVDAAKYQAARLARIAGGLFPDPPATPNLDQPAAAGPRTLMSWGLFVFGLETASYGSYTRRRGWRHAATERFGARPAHQYVGPGDDAVTLSGTLIPELGAAYGAMETLAEMAATGDAHSLIDGRGTVWGEYVVESIDEGGRNIIAGGIARHIDFTIDLKRVD